MATTSRTVTTTTSRDGTEIGYRTSGHGPAPSWRGRVESAHTFPCELATPPERRFDPLAAAEVPAPVLMLP